MRSLLLSAVLLALVACGKKDETPDPNTAAGVQPGQPGYVQPQPGQPGYVQPCPAGTLPSTVSGYPPPCIPGPPAQTQPGYTQPPQPGYTQPAQPQAGAMAVPGPNAMACQNDSQCVTHKCNTQYGKCAFPCASDVDCIQGSYCFKGPIPACLPKMPGQ